MSVPAPATRRAHRLPHVGALDGLRAVALIAVLCYHGGFGWARGGFLGVSTFFTLSGFLITSLLLVQRKDTATIALGPFWTARARRLLPAALVTLVIVVLFARFAATPTQLTGLRGDLLSSFGLVTNWRLALSGKGYGAYVATSSPVQHIWSLAVEEQFYLFLPLLVLYGTRGSAKPQNRLAIIAGVLAAASTVALVTAVGRHGDTTWAYYATYTRAAELLAGVILACVAHHVVEWKHRNAVVPVAGLVGAAVLVGAWVRADQAAPWLYRGGLSVYTLASVAVILASLQGGPIRSVLSTQVLQWIGRLSYSAYLYHWPLFLWLTKARVGFGGVALFAVRVGLTIGLAALSTAFLERPIRARRLLPRVDPAPMFGALAVALALVMIVPAAASDNGPSGVHVVSGERIAAAATTAPITQVTNHGSTLPPVPHVTKLLLVGDSLMHQASFFFAQALPGVDVRWVGKDGAGPLTEQGQVVGAVNDAVRDFDPDVVLIEFAGSYLTRIGGRPFITSAGTRVRDGSDLMYEVWDEQSHTIVKEARSKGAEVLWALTPAIEPNGFFGYLAAGVPRLNDIYRHLPSTGIVDWYTASLGADGGFSADLADARGHRETARQPDGLHFTAFGYRLLVAVARPAIDGYHGRVLPPA